MIYTHGRAILTKAFYGIKEKSESIRHVTFESEGIANSDSVSYILMEPGVCSLLDMISYKSETESRWGKEEIILILNDVSAALSSLKKERIAHCDIEPGNIIITEDGYYKLADFGMSVALQNDDSYVEGRCKGTKGYMAPEIFGKHDPFKAALYSFGIVIKEILQNSNNTNASKIFEEIALKLTDDNPELRTEVDELTILSDSLLKVHVTDFKSQREDIKTIASKSRIAKFESNAVSSNSDLFSQYILGWMYEKGYFTDTDSQEAIKWYTKAGNQNNAAAQYRLAMIYFSEETTEQNLDEAIELSKKFTSQGYRMGKMTLANQKFFFEYIEKIDANTKDISLLHLDLDKDGIDILKMKLPATLAALNLSGKTKK